MTADLVAFPASPDAARELDRKYFSRNRTKRMRVRRHIRGETVDPENNKTWTAVVRVPHAFNDCAYDQIRIHGLTAPHTRELGGQALELLDRAASFGLPVEAALLVITQRAVLTFGEDGYAVAPADMESLGSPMTLDEMRQYFKDDPERPFAIGFDPMAGLTDRQAVPVPGVAVFNGDDNA